MLDYQRRCYGYPVRTRVPGGWYDYAPQLRRSPSLIRANKVKRDRARMTAFILRKTEANMPFAELDTSEIVKLGTNTSVHRTISSIKITTTVSTQTIEDVVQNDHANLKSEIGRLEQENVKLIDRIQTLEQQFCEQSKVISVLTRERDSERLSVQLLQDLNTEQKCKLNEQLASAKSEINDLHAALSSYEQQSYIQSHPESYENMQTHPDSSTSNIQEQFQIQLDLLEKKLQSYNQPHSQSYENMQPHPGPYIEPHQQSYIQPHSESYENMQPHAGPYIQPHQHPYNPPYQQLDYQQQQAPPGRQRRRRGARRGH